MKRLILCGMIVLFIMGCSVVEIPDPVSVIKQPLGTDSVKVGMEKNEVRAIWGEPDDIHLETDKMSNRTREVWTYIARYSNVPLDADYLSKTRHVYFDGNNVTKISD